MFGLGIEVMGETADALPQQLNGSWLFAVVYAVSQQAAAHGGFRGLIDEFGVLSMEIKAPAALRPLANSDGSLGLFLGLQSPTLPLEWELPAGLVKVVTVKVLQPKELAYSVEHDAAGAHTCGICLSPMAAIICRRYRRQQLCEAGWGITCRATRRARGPDLRRILYSKPSSLVRTWRSEPAETVRCLPSFEEKLSSQSPCENVRARLAPRQK